MSSAKKPPMKKKNVIDEKIQQRDALVVGGEQPRPYAVLLIKVIFAFNGLRDRDLHTYCTWVPLN